MAKRMIAQFNPLYFISSDFVAILGPPRQCVSIVAALAAVFVIDALRMLRPGLAKRILSQPAAIRWPFYILAVFSILALGAYGKGNASPQFIYFQF